MEEAKQRTAVDGGSRNMHFNHIKILINKSQFKCTLKMFPLPSDSRSNRSYLHNIMLLKVQRWNV